MSRKKPAIKVLRAKQGYDRRPPMCFNCAHFIKPQPKVPPRCGIGGFVVSCHAVCDLWHGKNGETLEC